MIYSTHKKSIRHYSVDFLVALVIVILFVMSSAVYADSVKPISSANSGYIFQVFIGLIIVIAMIFTVASIAKRFGAGTILNNQHMQIVSTLSLGQKEKVIIIEAGDQQLLLGVTAQQITNLYAFEEPAVDLKTKKEMSDFKHKIQNFLKPQIQDNKRYSLDEAKEAEDDSYKTASKKDDL